MTQLDDRTPAAAIPTETELLGRARDLGPMLKKNAAQTETDRRVAEENIQAITDAGLFRIAVPKRYGGYEVPIRTFVQISSELGRACGSTAWATTLINVCAWLTGLYPQQAQDEVFAGDPDARVAGVLAPTATSQKADGGQVVTGRWGFASGSLHASWVIVGIPVVDETGETIDQGLALIPRAEISIDDTWYVAGMRGTGSNTIVADQVFVPDHRILSVPPAVGGAYPTEHKDERLYHSAFVPVLALVLNGTMVGLAHGALDLVTEMLAKGRGIAYTFYDNASLAPPSSSRWPRRPSSPTPRGCTCCALPTTSTAARRPTRTWISSPGPGSGRRRHYRQTQPRSGRPAAERAWGRELRRGQPAAADLARPGGLHPPRRRERRDLQGAIRPGAARRPGTDHRPDLKSVRAQTSPARPDYRTRSTPVTITRESSIIFRPASRRRPLDGRAASTATRPLGICASSATSRCRCATACTCWLTSTPGRADDRSPVLIAWAPYGKHGALDWRNWPGTRLTSTSLSPYTAFETPDPAYWTGATR